MRRREKHTATFDRAACVPMGKSMSVKEAIAALQKFRKGKTLGDLNLKEMKEEGRR